jgi:hypothetical protein
MGAVFVEDINLSGPGGSMVAKIIMFWGLGVSVAFMIVKGVLKGVLTAPLLQHSFCEAGQTVRQDSDCPLKGAAHCMRIKMGFVSSIGVHPEHVPPGGGMQVHRFMMFSARI